MRGEEKGKWAAILKLGVYETFQKVTGADRADTKLALISFFGGASSGLFVRKIAAYMKREFSDFYAWFAKTKKELWHGFLAVELLSEESQVVIDGVAAKSDYPLITIHDCVLVPASSAKQAQEDMEEAFFEYYGYEIETSVDDYSKTEENSMITTEDNVDDEMVVEYELSCEELDITIQDDGTELLFGMNDDLGYLMSVDGVEWRTEGDSLVIPVLNGYGSPFIISIDLREMEIVSCERTLDDPVSNGMGVASWFAIPSLELELGCV